MGVSHKANLHFYLMNVNHCSGQNSTQHVWDTSGHLK